MDYPALGTRVTFGQVTQRDRDGVLATRGATLDTLDIPAADPGPSWFLRVLGSPPPEGVRADPDPDIPGRRATTLCTLVADLTTGEAVIAARGDDPVAIPLPDLAEGNPRAQRPHQQRALDSGASGVVP